MRLAVGGWLAIATLMAAPASAQPESAGEIELMPRTLEVEPEAVEPEAPEEEPARLPILERIGPTRRAPEEESEPLPPDIAFTVPSAAEDPRVRYVGLQMPPEEPPPPPPYAIVVGAGWSRQLAQVGPIDYLRIEQRFEARLPELAGFVFGVGVAELVDLSNVDRFLVEVGPRVGFGVGFCDDRLVRCEGAVHVQPGLAAGHLGALFDLQASLDLRFLFARVLVLSAGGAFSFIGSQTFVSLDGTAGLAF